MSRKANPTVIGGFVAGAAALAVAAVLLFGGGRFFQEKHRFVLFFDGSVKGLTVGAPVVCRGVRIGTVTDLRVRIDSKDLSVHIPVFIEVDADRLVQREDQGEKGIRWSVSQLVERGLRGQLEIQSLVTGQLMVDLDFHPGKAGLVSGIPMGLPEIPTIPTTFQELLRTVEELPLQEIARRTGNTLAGIEKMVNSPELTQSLHSAGVALEEFRRLAVETRQAVGSALAKVNGAVDGVQKVVTELDARVGSVANGVEATVRDAHGLVQRVDRRVDPLADKFGETLGEVQAVTRRLDAQVDPVLTSVQEAALEAGKLARHAGENLQPVLLSLRQASDKASDALAQASRTLGALGGASASDSALGREVSNALREVSATARSLRVLADYLDQHPDALLRGKAEPGGLR